jgi:hypothetical protein
MIEVVWNIISATAWLATIATWSGVLLVPLAMLGWLIVRRDRAVARWLLLLPVAWLFPLGFATWISTPYPTAPPIIAAWVAVVLCFLIAPVFAWERKVNSWRVIAWCVVNLLCSLSTLPVISFPVFTT